MKKAKKQAPKEMPPKFNPDFLKYMERENEMLDDHGPVILGGRDRKPILPKPKQEED